MKLAEGRDRSWAILIARWILGLIFFMAGEWKVFVLGPVEHARRLFVEPYAHAFLPAGRCGPPGRWSRWWSWSPAPSSWSGCGPGGAAGAGWRAGTGHLWSSADRALYEFHTHVIPRAALLIFLLVMPRSEDVFSVDGWLRRRRLLRPQ